MDKKALLEPRKAASQQRSRATIEALVEATARVLIREGFDQANTNRIAQEAGVSIGSLYQYFPSKESLVVAVIERHKGEMVDVLRRTLDKVASMPIDRAVRELIKTMIEAHRVNPGLHRVLVEETPRTGRLGAIDSFDNEFYELIRAYLEQHKTSLRPMDLELATYICVRVTEALTHGAVVESPERLNEGRVETFIDEVTTLITRYLA
ncbi:TetR family transcriptional regulator [Ensifer sp. ENS02]|uniref:TetR/AcrR family transcriptional regulator n=1 Tax=Ensifer sp. ENS02 TaxID=2769290 RepID=UPI00177BE6FF|nr:TetR/AcrR family transcriptional regulator [Ensifer sp. ENS02]MBD9524232.1 TetR family transcriptional regulator [Ensifer sp. ENS02]